LVWLIFLPILPPITFLCLERALGTVRSSLFPLVVERSSRQDVLTLLPFGVGGLPLALPLIPQATFSPPPSQDYSSPPLWNLCFESVAAPLKRKLFAPSLYQITSRLHLVEWELELFQAPGSLVKAPPFSSVVMTSRWLEDMYLARRLAYLLPSYSPLFFRFAIDAV